MDRRFVQSPSTFLFRMGSSPEVNPTDLRNISSKMSCENNCNLLFTKDSSDICDLKVNISGFVFEFLVRTPSGRLLPFRKC